MSNSLEAILIIEYPTPAAFIEMVTTKEYAKVHEHQAAQDASPDSVGTNT